jgi:hypothetical protein
LTGTTIYGGVGKRELSSEECWYAAVMKKFLPTAFGVALGTLIYTRWLDSAHVFDWGRAIFVGVVCGIGAAVWPDKRAGKAGGDGR